MEDHADPLIRVPFGPDLTAAGIAWVVRALACGHVSPGGMRHLWRQISGVAVELALRRVLLARQIPFRVVHAAPFARPERYALVVGGRRLHVVTAMITGRAAQRRLLRDPHRWWRTQTLPAGWLRQARQMGRPDLCLFAWATARTVPGFELATSVQAAGEPVSPFYLLPEAWRRGTPWRSLGQVTVAGVLGTPVTLELGAQGPGRRYLPLRFNLGPPESFRVEDGIHKLVCVQASPWPDGPVRLSSPGVTRSVTVLPSQWSNLWLYGREIILAGYLNGLEVRRLAQARRRAILDQTPPDPGWHGRLPIRALRSLPQLLESARRWADAPAGRNSL